MEKGKFKNYTANDFLKEKSFLRWQLLESEEDALFWSEIIERWPNLDLPIKEAIELYKDNIRFNDFTMSDAEVSEHVISLQKRIRYEKKRRTRKRVAITISAIAASLLLFIYLPLPFDDSKEVQDISSFAQAIPDNNDLYSSETKLIVSETNTLILKNNDSFIQYGKDTLKADGNLLLKEDLSPYNQLVTPYGKRSEIIFSDGTKAWVNAGSKLTYPAEFNKTQREIYVDGEIYIEVSEDKKRPFVIKTRQMDIEVLGTKFNVSAYETDKTNSVVLLSGSVGIFSNSSNKHLVLKPDQMYSDSDGSHTVKNVDAAIHVLWVQGLYQFQSENLSNIVTRLERYYGIPIECDTALSDLKCSGKLDLKDDMNKLFEELSRALPITYRQNDDGSYTINKI